MKSPFYFITKPCGSRYSNTKSISGVDIIVNTSEEDHKFSNRFAKVVETPLGYTGPIKAGDTLIVHHNTFKFYNDVKGRRKSGKSFFKEDIFMIEYDQFFMYGDSEGWHAHDRYCFVKPIPAVDSEIKKPFSEEPLTGVMMYPNAYLRSKGINEGDTVIFSPESEYEFTIDDEKLYRIFDHQITVKL